MPAPDTSKSPPSLALDRALALHDDVQRVPRQVITTATAQLDRAGGGLVRAVLEWAIGRARFEMGELGPARDILRVAARRAQRHGAADYVGRIRMNLAVVEAESGMSSRALATLARCERDLPLAEAPRALSQRTLVLYLRGDLDAAQAAADRGIAEVYRLDDRFGILRQLINRAIVALNAGRLDDAVADLRTALPVAHELEQHLIVAIIEHNEAVAAARWGDLATALRRFDAAEAQYRALDSPARVMLILEVDRAEALLLGGLAGEAVNTARRAVALAERAGHRASRAEALLLLSRAQARAGSGEAAQSAREAERCFRADRRPAWAAVAARYAFEADTVHALPGSSFDQRRGRQLATRLARSGWEWEALAVELMSARHLFSDGHHEAIATAQTLLTANRRRKLPLSLASQVDELDACVCLATGHPRGARRAIERGLRSIDAARSHLASPELRAGASATGERLAELGIGMVLPAGMAAAAPGTTVVLTDAQAARLLATCERWRASSLVGSPPQPRGSELSRRLAALRSVQAGAASAEPGTRLAAQYRRLVVAAERAVRDAAGATRAEAATRHDRLDLPSARRALDGTSVLEYFELGGTLYLLHLRQHAARVAVISPSAVAVTEVAYQANDLRRAVLHGTARHLARVDATADALQTMLLPGMVDDLDRRVIIVPSPALTRLAWAALPALAEREVTVAPSCRRWLATADERRPTALTVLGVAGPGLDHAAAEVLATAATVEAGGGRAIVLTGEAATSTSLLARLGEVDHAHLAVHGRFREDNPQLSELLLTDGPLTLYEIGTAERLPATVTMSVCAAGRAAGLLGNEIVGVVGTLLAAGVRSIVAPLDVVSDDACRQLMPGFYRAINQGASFAEGLRAIRVGAGDDPTLAPTARLLGAFGA